MTRFSPSKSSSRAGRFKKKLVSEAELSLEAPLVRAKLLTLHELYAAGKISDSEFVSAYALAYLSHRYPGQWLGSKARLGSSAKSVSLKDLPFSFEPNIEKRLPETLGEVFSNFALKSTPLAVNRALLEWGKGNYHLVLMTRIPSPIEVLEQQRLGRRCVTTLIDERIGRFVLGERDALSFTMHDLIHADHFYFNNESYQGQLGFYGLLHKTKSYFDLEHEKFQQEFEYLISDMNAYPIHLLKCLKSAMVHHFSTDYFNNWIDLPEELHLLNTKEYLPEVMDRKILDWLDAFRDREAPLPIKEHGVRTSQMPEGMPLEKTRGITAHVKLIDQKESERKN
jgi:hypothetical protein